MSASSKLDKPTSPEQLVQQLIAASGLPPFVLILCESALRRSRVLDALLKKCAGCPAQRWEGKDLTAQSLARLLEGLGSLSLFNAREIHILKNVQELPTEIAKRLASALLNFPDSHPSTLFLIGTELKSTHPLLSLARKQKVAIELTTLETPELTRWAQAECKRQQLSLEPGVLEHLVESSAGSPDLLASQIEHLSLYVDGRAVGLKDLQSLFPGSGASATEFEFVDAVLDRNLVQAEELLAKLLKAGSNQFGILALLQRSFSNGLQISYLKKSGLPDEQLAQQLGMPVWLLRKQAPRAIRNGPARLRRGLELMLRCDARMKNLSLGPELLISELVQHLSA